jgi:hypothetical protein
MLKSRTKLQSKELLLLWMSIILSGAVLLALLFALLNKSETYSSMPMDLPGRFIVRLSESASPASIEDMFDNNKAADRASQDWNRLISQLGPFKSYKIASISSDKRNCSVVCDMLFARGRARASIRFQTNGSAAGDWKAVGMKISN